MFLDGLHLARDEFIALAQDLTALRMTADDIAAAEAFQHGRRYLSGECALFFRVDILRAPTDRGTGEEEIRQRQVSERRADEHFHALFLLQFEMLEEGLRLFDRAVHFPVSCD